MCGTKIFSLFSQKCINCLNQSCLNQIQTVQSTQKSNHFSNAFYSGISNQQAQEIRSNKQNIKKNLKNSLNISKMHLSSNNNEENNTISSLKEICFDNKISAQQQGFGNQNQYSTAKISKYQVDSCQNSVFNLFSVKYTILKKLGQGAHSTVYKCSRKLDNKIYAVKKIKNVSYQNWKKLKSLYRMIKNINHNSIIKYYDYYFDQQKCTAYAIMEYCEFHDLRFQLSQKLKNGKTFTNSEILCIVQKIAEALKYLHEEGICHRDLKPENILYCKFSGQIKIIDLDVCGVKKLKCQNFDMWTCTGTLSYRAPESFQIGYTQKVDLWSLGVVAYQLLTGNIPFQTQYQKDFLNKIRDTEIDYDKITQNTKLKGLIQKCLIKDFHNRISASQMCDYLKLIIKDDDSLIKADKYQFQRQRTSYSDSYMRVICLGNLLKFTTS